MKGVTSTTAITDAVHVTATILTYDAPEALGRCLDAISQQTRLPDRIVLIDNHGPIPVQNRDVVRQNLPIEIVRLEDNLGPAGGHAAAFTRFLESDSDFIWVMDDDIVPEPDCLQRLLGQARKMDEAVLVYPHVVDPEGLAHEYPAWHGFIMSREAVIQAGIPRAELVWWAEDTEYLQHRVPQAGVQVARVQQAVTVHCLARRARPKRASRYYYEARNSVYYRLRLQRPRKLKKCLKTMGRLYLRPLIRREDRRLLKVLRTTQGISDGLRGRLGKRFEM